MLLRCNVLNNNEIQSDFVPILRSAVCKTEIIVLSHPSSQSIPERRTMEEVVGRATIPLRRLLPVSYWQFPMEPGATIARANDAPSLVASSRHRVCARAPLTLTTNRPQKLPSAHNQPIVRKKSFNQKE